jgi:hypothetical protein
MDIEDEIQKRPVEVPSRRPEFRMRLASFFYVGRLWAFGSLNNFKFDRISFLQRAVAISHNRGIMNEYVWAIIAPDEAIAFRVVEPFHSTSHLR